MLGVRRGVLPGSYPVSQRWTPQSQWDLLPGGHKVLGVNVTDWSNSTSYPDHSANLWTEWPWTTWILPQLQQAQSIGANTIRFFSSQMVRYPAYSPFTPQMSDATFYGQWDQLLAWCRQNGMYCYPTIGGSDWNNCDFGGYTGWGFPDTTAGWNAMYAEQAQNLRFFQKYLDVIIGVDLNNEAGNWSVGTAGIGGYRGADMYANAKTCSGPIPLTISMSCNALPSSPGQNVNGQWVPNYVNTLDFVDVHFYCDPTSAQAGVQAWQAYYNLPVLIGEFGQSIANGSRATRYNNIKDVVVNGTTNTPGAALVKTSGSSGPTSGTYKVQVTFVTAAGESKAIGTTSIAVNGSQSIYVYSPGTASAHVTGVTGYNIYISQAAGSTLYLQNGSPTAIGTDYTQATTPTTSGAQPPASDTSGLAARHIAGAMAWSMWDQDVITSNEWGIAGPMQGSDAPNDPTPQPLRSDVLSTFESFPN